MKIYQQRLMKIHQQRLMKIYQQRLIKNQQRLNKSKTVDFNLATAWKFRLVVRRGFCPLYGIVKWGSIPWQLFSAGC